MANLATIRAGFASVLKRSIKGAQCNGYLLPAGQITAPAFEIEPAEITYDLAMGGFNDLNFTVRAIAAANLDVGAQMKLDPFFFSVRTALEVDRTLAGSASDSRVVSATGPRRAVIGQTEYIVAEFTVRVLASD